MAIPLQYNLRNLAVRRTATLMTAGGIGLVVAILILTLSLAHGFRATLIATGRPDNAIVIRAGSNSEVQSSVARDVARIIEADPGVREAADGSPLAVAESVVLTNLTRKGGGSSNIVVRGVDEHVLALRPEVRISEGRFFKPGQDEVIVGIPLSRRFVGCGLGDHLRFGARDFTVVGVFDAGGSGFGSEVWGDSQTLMPLFDRNTYSSVTIRLTNPDGFKACKSRLEADPRLKVEAFLERDYYSAQSSAVATVIRIVGVFLVIVMASGAIFGALNTMYAAVGSRTREIGTMLALGFSPREILLSFMVESILLSIVGGILGCILALPINGMSTGTTNWQTFSEVAFQFRITPQIMLIGLLASIALGVIGGYFPARYAAGRTISEALREG
jgi:ABC-type lipoprotein release transport system permease subunit